MHVSKTSIVFVVGADTRGGLGGSSHPPLPMAVISIRSKGKLGKEKKGDRVSKMREEDTHHPPIFVD